MNYGGHYRNDEAERCIEQARRGRPRRGLQPDRQQGAADSGHRAGRGGTASRCPSRHARSSTDQEYHTSFWGHLGLLHLAALSHAGFQRLPAQCAELAVSAQRRHRRHGARAGRARRLRASVRHGACARARADHECLARRCRARQGRLHRSRRLRGPQGDRGSLVQAAEPRLPRADRLGHRCDGELREPARTGRA